MKHLKVSEIPIGGKFKIDGYPDVFTSLGIVGTRVAKNTYGARILGSPLPFFLKGDKVVELVEEVEE